MMNFVHYFLRRQRRMRPPRCLSMVGTRRCTLVTSADAQTYAFSFGIVADVQYADVPDATNFRGTERRRYRESVKCLDQAVKCWTEEVQDDKRNLKFIGVMQLGDLIDGQNSGKYGNGLAFENSPKSEEAWSVVKKAITTNTEELGRWYHLVGNHELYNFAHSHMPKRLEHESLVQVPRSNYYSFCPHAHWRFIVLDAYAVSTLGRHENEPSAKLAAEVLAANNPNPLDGSVDFTKGLYGPALRFLPYNGGLGKTQLNWLKTELDNAQSNGERVIVFTHVPIHPVASSYSCVAWDYKDALDVLRSVPAGLVAAVFAGHQHSGGYCTDHVSDNCQSAIDTSDGAYTHHFTLKSPLTNMGSAKKANANCVQQPESTRKAVHKVRDYDSLDIATARRRLEQELKGVNSNTNSVCFVHDNLAPFGTIHVHDRWIDIVGYGAMPSRRLNL